MAINLTQAFEYETDSLTSFEKVLDTMVRIMFEEKPSQYAQLFVTQRSDSFADGRQWVTGSLKNSAHWSKPRYLPVCSVRDYRRDLKEGDETFENHAAVVQSVMEHLKKADVKEFFKRCGHGYHAAFNECDGSIGAGYRLKQSYWSGVEFLGVSLCHIYYGK